MKGMWTAVLIGIAAGIAYGGQSAPAWAWIAMLAVLALLAAACWLL